MEFRIDSLPETEFRDKPDTSSIDLLAMTTQIDFDNFAKTRETFTFALEHLEVKSGDKWLPVKVPGHEVYMPIGIEKNYKALTALCKWYTENVLMVVFRESAE